MTWIQRLLLQIALSACIAGMLAYAAVRCGAVTQVRYLSWKLFVALLLFASAADAQDVVDVTAFCPRMPVTRLSIFPNVWECAREVGTGRAKFNKDKIITFQEFVISPTLVRKVLIGHMVDACNQFGYSDQMDQLSIDLPNERVVLGVAAKMRARTTLTLHTGEVYEGWVTYPRCRSHRVGFGQREAEEVTAVGSVSQP